MAAKTVTIRLTPEAYALLEARAERAMSTPTGYATRVLVDTLVADRNVGNV